MGTQLIVWKMEQFLSILILIVILVTSSQQQEPQCEKSECVIITNCPSFLQLVKKMKSGDHEARKKLCRVSVVLKVPYLKSVATTEVKMVNLKFLEKLKLLKNFQFLLPS